jgi:serine/threonine protein kinase
MAFIDWNTTSHVNRGAFGNVYEGTVNPTSPKIPRCQPGSTVAVKVIQIDPTDQTGQHNFMRERDTLCEVVHPCCLYLIAWDWIPGKAGVSPQGIFVTELLATDLAKVLAEVKMGRGRTNFKPTQKSFIAFGVAFGMAYLHSLNIVHRDLKPANILLTEEFWPRIGDFGLSKRISLESALQMTINLGTPVYMAPELYSDEWSSEDVSGAVDVFSFGLILWALTADKEPGFGDTIGGKRPVIPKNVTPEMRELIELCWAETPEDRPRFDMIVNAPLALLFDEADEAAYMDFCYDLVQAYRV